MADPEIPETGFKHFHTVRTGHDHQSLPLRWCRGQGVGLYVEHGGKLVMSSQVKQNKAFWRVTSNCLEKRLKGDGAAGKEVRKKGFQVCGPSQGTWTDRKSVV